MRGMPHGRLRQAALVAMSVALVSVPVATASPASAASIRYPIRNGTSEVLRFSDISGAPFRCVDGVAAVLCLVPRSGLEASLSARFVPPGGTLTVTTTRDPGKPADHPYHLGTITVRYVIGSGANDKVVLVADPDTGRCSVHGTTRYACTDTGAGYTFTLAPAA